MSAASQLSYKLAITSQAIATMGVDPRWDFAVGNYLRTFSLWQADEEFGVKAKANEAWLCGRMSLESRFGKDWRRHPQAAAEVAQAEATSEAADDIHHAAFVDPYWKALRDLVTTPSPSIAAATFKGLLIQAEEVWNDNAMEGDCMQIVVDDFARLLPKQGAL